MYVRSGLSGMGALNCPGDPGCPGNPATVTLDQLWNLPTTSTNQSLLLQSLIAQAQPGGAATGDGGVPVATGGGFTAWISQHAGTIALVGGSFFLVVLLSRMAR